MCRRVEQACSECGWIGRIWLCIYRLIVHCRGCGRGGIENVGSDWPGAGQLGSLHAEHILGYPAFELLDIKLPLLQLRLLFPIHIPHV